MITPTRCIHIEVAFIAHYSIIYILHHTYFLTESCINPEKPEGNCITILQANLYKAIPFFLHLGSIPTDPNLVFILQKKRNDVVKPFLTLTDPFNLKNGNSISRHRGFVGISCLLFITTSTIKFSAILSLCWFGVHVLLFPGSTAMMLGFQASCCLTSCDFFPLFFSNRMTQTQEMHMMLNDKQKGDGLITEEEKLALRPYYYQLTKLSLSSPLSLFWHLQMSMWNFTPITNILISNILDWREKSQSLPIQLL